MPFKVAKEVGEAAEAVRVAVASSDGRYVNDHFGRARQFLVFEIKDDQFRFLEVRENVPPCLGGEHDDHRLARTVELFSDCRGVLVSRIGPGAIEALAARGIEAYVIPDFIDEALKRLISSGELKNDRKVEKTLI